MTLYVFNGVKAENFTGNVEAATTTEAELLVNQYLHGTLSAEDKEKVSLVREAKESRCSVTEAAPESTSGCCCKG